jgi:hypothetical protein
MFVALPMPGASPSLPLKAAREPLPGLPRQRRSA